MAKKIESINDLTPDDNNANKGTVRGLAMLEDSLQKYGAGRSILIDKNGNVIAGNKTLERAAELGLEVEVVQSDGNKLVAVQRTDLDLYADPKARELAYADNRVAEVDLAWDAESLLADMNDGVDLAKFFDRDELDELLADVSGDEPTADPGAQIDRAGELQEKWQVQRGDLWVIPSKSGKGEHRLLCGDSTNADDVAWVMGVEKFRVMWTDPPYGVGHSGGTKDPRARTYRRGDKLENDSLNENETEAFVTKAFACAYAHGMQGAAAYVAAPSGPLHRRFIDAMDNSGFVYRHGLVWVKDTFVFGRSDYHYRHEPILYGWKDDGAHYFTDDRTQDSVFNISRPVNSQDDQGHPTSKPIELVAQQVKNSSKANEIAYEPFSGSGTTLVACEQISRQCRAIEIEPKYVAVALERLSLMGLEPRKVEA